jgi:glycosyltransferase involved in cell wall biosynthesis
MKVVWLCHFSNHQVQRVIKPLHPVNETAPWIANLIRLFEDQKDIEIHIVSPHEYIGADIQFEYKGIHYHFFNAHIPLWGRHWPSFFKFDYWTDFFLNKLKVRKIINRIKPDIIHLHGAENAYYSSSIIQFKVKYPILITIQGFISHANSTNHPQTKMRVRYEKEILKRFTHFGYRTISMGKNILSLNPDAKLHWHNYPIMGIKPLDIEKRYDIIFFASLSKEKGIEDLLQAISVVKSNFPHVAVCIIGSCASKYLNYLKNMATDLGISKNIYWAGFLDTQADVHKMASSSRICVLPTWHDIIPGTIIESMFLKLPVVAYSVGGITEINDKNECISLVAKGDINALAEKILWLLKNPEIQKLNGRRAYIRAIEMFDNTKICGDLLSAYKEVIHEFEKK